MAKDNVPAGNPPPNSTYWMTLAIGQGNYFYFGDKMTGTSTVPTIHLDSGVENATIGDLYYYDGLIDANRGNIYKCVLGGGASIAEWVYSHNIRGTPGQGAVNSVNGIEPDVNGNVLIDASDIPDTVLSVNNISPDENGNVAIPEIIDTEIDSIMV